MSRESKILSLVLRHKPEVIGITLDKNGWVLVSDLICGMKNYGRPITMVELENIVATNDKKRFAFNDDHTKIRANQGHSVEIDLALTETTPPPILYHGTAQSSVESIKQSGLTKMKRQHVHLSADKETAIKVGSRHGKPVVLKINTAQMLVDGYKFYQAANGVWLTDKVPYEYISFNYE